MSEAVAVAAIGSSSAPATTPAVAAPAPAKGSANAQEGGLAGKAEPGAAATTEATKVTQEAVEEGTLDELPAEYLDKRVTIKVDGESKRMTVREAIKLQQLEQASRAKMSKADTLEKQVRGLLSRLDDPMEYFKIRGIDPVEFAESTLQEKLAFLEKTPEQRELEELRGERAERLAREKEQQELSEREAASKMQSEQQQQFNTEFVEAWKVSGLPPDRLYGQLLAAEMVSANARHENLSWKDAAAKVKEKLRRTLSSSISSLDPQGILEWVGQDAAKKLREYDVKRVSQGTTPTVNSGPRPDGNSLSVSPRTREKSNQSTQVKRASENAWDDFWKS